MNTTFYLALTLMMGVLTVGRPLLLGVSMGVHFGGVMAISFLAKFLGQFVLLAPWSLFNALPAAVLGAPLPLSVWVPIGVTASLNRSKRNGSLDKLKALWYYCISYTRYHTQYEVPDARFTHT